MSDPKETPPDKRSIPARRLNNGAAEPDLSATVDRPIMGYLSIEVTFLGEPVANLKVVFKYPDGRTVPAFKPLTGSGKGLSSDHTDAAGRCAIQLPMPIGIYSCHIQHQPPAPITTVEAIDRPFVIVLPVGRSYGDCYNHFAPTADKIAALRKEKL